MKWFIILHRIAFDYDDSIFIIETASKQDALIAAEADLRQQRDDEGEDNEDEDYIVSYVIECDNKPVVVQNPED